MHRFFFYLLVVLLPTQLGIHFWPEWSMVLGRRVDYLSPTLFFTDILIILLLLSWAISLGDIRRFRKLGSSLSPKLSFATKLSFFTRWAFIGFVIANIAFSVSHPVAVFAWIKVLEFVLLGLYIVKTKPNVLFIAYCLLVSVLYSSLIAIGQFLLQRAIGGPLWFLGERTFSMDTPGIARIVLGGKEFLRVYATFPHPNVLGGYIAVVLPLLIREYTNTRISEFVKKIYVITIILGVIALVLTFSRSALVVFILGSGYWAWQKKKHKFWVPLLAAAMMAFVFFFLPVSSTDESVVVRGQLNNAAIKIWQSFPLFGVGLGNFLVALPQFLPSRTIYFLQPVHNIYLLLLAEIGIVGIGITAWLVFLLIKQKKSLLILIKSGSPIFYSLVSILLLGLVDHYPLTLQQGRLLLTLLVGLTIVEVSKGKKQKS